MENNKNQNVSLNSESELIEKENNFFESNENLQYKEETLKKWYNELLKKESLLEIRNQEIIARTIELETKEKNAEEELAARMKLEEAKALKNTEEEQLAERKKFDKEIEEKRNDFEKEKKRKFEELEKELEIKRKECSDFLNQIRHKQDEELKKERLLQEEELSKKRQEQLENLKIEKEKALKLQDENYTERTKELSDGEEKLKKEKAEFEEEKRRVKDLERVTEDRTKSLDQKEEELITFERKNARVEKHLEKERERIEEAENDLDSHVKEKIAETIKDYNSKIEMKDKEIENLRIQLSAAVNEVNIVKNFKAVYGDDPSVIIQTIQELRDSNGKLREKIANSSDREELDRVANENRILTGKVNVLTEENTKLNASYMLYSALDAKYKTLETEYKSLQANCESLNNQLTAKNQELVRLTMPEEKQEARKKRIEALEVGVLDKKDRIGAGEFDSRYNVKNEIEWLEGIWSKCEMYGIKFNKRLLYAFHTALKISEWSTITVLAGVSGTGKSELPRLYSEFGGLNFCSVAVQPNWDSQESMLGYFNSIDNQFQPEKLLKYLVQCTTDPDFNEYMSLVLLDEMNLAHVEHYFAEFLSKLESRRGLGKNDVPSIEVKLGARVDPYELKLSRTLLWTGTMNQDETTKSLSDKVLDRGIVINFPRPKKLERRKKMGLITKYIGNDSDRPKLHRETWESWTSHEIDFSTEQMERINHYKEIVESINKCLEDVGRALGHRVWQSIEYYIANYPKVRTAMDYQPEKVNIKEKIKTVWRPKNQELTTELESAMRIAFEDQIVQKIMPKLRGIETRDKKGKTSLRKIKELLEPEFSDLIEDFDFACDSGYGQFIWNSAKYLEANTVIDDMDNK